MCVFLVWLSLSSSRHYVVRHARRLNEVCIHQANYFLFFFVYDGEMHQMNWYYAF